MQSGPSQGWKSWSCRITDSAACRSTPRAHRPPSVQATACCTGMLLAYVDHSLFCGSRHSEGCRACGSWIAHTTDWPAAMRCRLPPSGVVVALAGRSCDGSASPRRRPHCHRFATQLLLHAARMCGSAIKIIRERGEVNCAAGCGGRLDFRANYELAALPVEIGQLRTLAACELGSNPVSTATLSPATSSAATLATPTDMLRQALVFPPPHIVDRGCAGLRDFLRTTSVSRPNRHPPPSCPSLSTPPHCNHNQNASPLPLLCALLADQG